MIDTFVLLTPIIMIGVVSLVVFVGCDIVFDLDRVEPKTPLLNAEPGDGRVDLEWANNPAAGEFRVKRGETAGTHELLATVNAGLYTYPDINVINGTTYYYVVSAMGEEGETPDSNEEAATPSSQASTEFVTGHTPGTLATAAGIYGMVVKVGAASLKVRELGRLAVAGNTQTHIVKVVDEATGADFGNPLAVSMTGVPEGEFKYAAVPDQTPIVLQANSTYYVVSQESNPGDQFLNHTTAVTTTSAATVTGAVRNTTGSYLMDATGAVSYGLVNLKYQIQ